MWRLSGMERWRGGRRYFEKTRRQILKVFIHGLWRDRWFYDLHFFLGESERTGERVNEKLSTCCGRAQTNHQLKRTERESSSPTEVADKAPAITMAATVSAMSQQTVGVSEPRA